MKIAIGADHRGFATKEYIKKHITPESDDITWIDVGAFNDTRSDYPVYAKEVAELILDGQAACGVLLCGTGSGVAMAANRFKGIYAAVAWSQAQAQEDKEHDHINVLALPADYLAPEKAVAIIRAWLRAQKLDGRYAERIAMVDAL